MSSAERTLTFERTVSAPPPVVYHALTNANALRNWLCDQSQADPREGGRLYFWWDSGYYAAGVFTALEADESISFSWHGRDEPGPTNVQIHLRAADGGTQLTLDHSGVGTGDAWEETRGELDKGWRIALENLQSVLETGEDLRLLRRPLLGIIPGEEVDAEVAARLGLPATDGVVVSDVLAGLGAEAAGMQKQDVIVEIGGTPISGYNSLGTALDPFYAGDDVAVIVYREGEEKTLTMRLSKRPMPDVPPTAGELAQAIEELYAQANAVLDKAVSEVSEQEASFRPAPMEWNIKEVLAHLIASERDAHGWIAGEVSGSVSAFNSNELVRLKAIISASPGVQELLADLKREQALTIAELRELPDKYIHERKGSYTDLARTLLQSHFHTNPHIDQIQELLAAAREGS